MTELLRSDMTIKLCSCGVNGKSRFDVLYGAAHRAWQTPPRVCAKHRSGEHGTRPGKKPVGSVGNPFSFVSVGLRHHRVRRRMFHGNRSFGSGYCTSYRFSWRNFLFPDEFDCFNDGFLFDPFLYGRSLNTYFWSDSLTSSGDSEDLTRPPETVENNLTTSAEQPGAAVAF